MDLQRDVDHRQIIRLHQHYGGGTALGRVLSLVEAAGCRTILTEFDPAEHEYAKERDEFYKHVFAVDEDARPIRLHFFDGDVAALEDIQEEDERYLGYCDLRPIPSHTISNALIDRRVFVKANKDYLFLICQRRFEIRLPSGIKLVVDAFPYVQQDGSIVRCAQAALTSIAQYYDSQLTGPDFTRIGSVYPSGARSIPSPGLNAPQIGMGLQKMDFEPLIYDFTNVPQQYRESVHCEQIIYRYVESRIPVLIGVDAGSEMHALVVIGHTFTPDSWLAHTRTGYYRQPKSGWSYHCSTTWIERFVVQDDNLGPYMLAPSEFIQLFACKLVVIPLPRHVYLQAEEAEDFVASFLNPTTQNICETLNTFVRRHLDAQQSRDSETTFWYHRFLQQVQNNELVLRTSLMTRDDWLKYLASGEAFVDYENIVNELPWPDLVWVVEISWPEIFVHGRKCAGEVALDPTSVLSPNTPTLDQTWLWLHVPGVVMSRNCKNGEKSISVLTGRDTIRSHRRTVED